ncbi:MAG TPA: GPW/gp25 family protein [Paucimonas sp.]|nr:GPW/gp25 family protein [Paucimonas sp.]
MTLLADIQSLHWQPALGGEGVVENIDDLNQAIQVILRTAKGSDPLRPEFGSDLHRYLDYPIHRARPHVVRESIEAIRRWEPRVAVERVEFTLVEAAHAAVRVVWRLADGFQGSTEIRL